MDIIKASTPSRICLFGEHQDYLGLEVIASAINLYFYAEIKKNGTDKVNIEIRSSLLDFLNAENRENKYDRLTIDLSKPIEYTSKTDFLRSTVNVLKRKGYGITGCDIRMDSEIPIGKGMCSSSTMVVVLVKALLELAGHPDKDDPFKIAALAVECEVTEFGNPGGMMDQVTSAVGGLINIDFGGGGFNVKPIGTSLEGEFILFDSLQQKNTIKILSDAKEPTLEGLRQLGSYGINSIKDFVDDPNKESLVKKLDSVLAQKVSANISNYKLLLEAKEMLSKGNIDNKRFGQLLYAHHCNLRDGLGTSTKRIDTILNTALENGALGGKVNGSGGGGCLFVYCMPDKTEDIIKSVEPLGFPSKVLRVSEGVRLLSK